MSDVTEKLQPWQEDFKCGGPPRENECSGNTVLCTLQYSQNNNNHNKQARSYFPCQ